MEELRDILQDLITFRNKISSEYMENSSYVKSNIFKEFALIMSVKTKRKFFILRPTTRNTEFVENIKKEYSNNEIEIYDKYKDGRYRESMRFDTLFDFYMSILTTNMGLEKSYKIITDKMIIIKKNSVFTEYLNAIILGHKLAYNKSFSLKQISFYNNRRNCLSLNGKKSLSNEIENFYKLIDNKLEVVSFALNSNQTFELTLKLKKDLENKIDNSYFKNTGEARNYKKILINDIKDYFSKIIDANEISIKDICVYTNIKDYNDYFKNLSYSVRSIVDVKNLYYKSKKDKLSCNIILKNLDFDYIMDIIDNIVLKKNKEKTS